MKWQEQENGRKEKDFHPDASEEEIQDWIKSLNLE